MTDTPPKKIAGQKIAPVFDAREDRLAREWNVPPEAVRAARATLKRGAHWEVVNKAVALSAEGLALLREKLGLPATAPNPDARTPRRIAGLLGPVPFDGKLIVWATPAKNTRLVIAYKPGTDPTNPLNLVSVRVRENQNFLRGMEIQARHIEHTSYEHEGPCPRTRGRY